MRFLDKLEVYAKEHGISLILPTQARFVGTVGRYEVESGDFKALADRLVRELAPWFRKVHLVNAISA